MTTQIRIRDGKIHVQQGELHEYEKWDLSLPFHTAADDVEQAINALEQQESFYGSDSLYGILPEDAEEHAHDAEALVDWLTGGFDAPSFRVSEVDERHLDSVDMDDLRDLARQLAEEVEQRDMETRIEARVAKILAACK